MDDRYITGIRATGELHIGNYITAIKPIIEKQETDDVFAFIAGYHAFIASHLSPDEFRDSQKNIFIDLVALGVNPYKATLYFQTDIPEVFELVWIFSQLITTPYLERGHSIKAVSSDKQTAGVLMYPLLMAADIIGTRSNAVFVGPDQKQHLEVASDIVKKLKNKYSGMTLVTPKGIFGNELMGVDGKKMSKSYNNTIPIFSDKETIASIISKVKTDSIPQGNPIDPTLCNLFTYYSLFANKKDIRQMKEQYEKGSIGYKKIKEELTETIWSYFKDARDRRKEIQTEIGLIDQWHARGSDKAREVLIDTISYIRNEVGIIRKLQ